MHQPISSVLPWRVTPFLPCREIQSSWQITWVTSNISILHPCLPLQVGLKKGTNLLIVLLTQEINSTRWLSLILDRHTNTLPYYGILDTNSLLYSSFTPVGNQCTDGLTFEVSPNMYLS